MYHREYKRRTLIDRKDLLVKIKTPGLNEVDDDEQINTEAGFDMLADIDRQSKGHSNRNFSQTNNLNKTSGTEPDLTSFDFLNEYEE